MLKYYIIAKSLAAMSLRKKINDQVKYLIGLTGPRNAIRLRYFHGFKHFPNLKNPQTFNEKINAYKFMDDRYEFHKYADKVAVKDYVATTIGAEHVIPTLYSGKTLPPVSERNWPLPYVIKTNHGSGWNILVRNEQERDWSVIDKKVNKWLKTAYGKDSGEVHYQKIEPMVLVEKFISEKDGVSPVDYKFHMIHGRTEFIEVDVDRHTVPMYAYYDKNWNKLHFTIEEFTTKVPVFSTLEIPKPKNFEKMLTLAEKLSKPFPLVRVDFYETNGQIYFGELTFTPFAGFCKFFPAEYDYKYGALLNLK